MNNKQYVRQLQNLPPMYTNYIIKAISCYKNIDKFLYEFGHSRSKKHTIQSPKCRPILYTVRNTCGEQEKWLVVL